MNPIAVAAIVVAAAVLLAVLLGRTALRGAKREGELRAEVEDLQLDEAVRKRIEKVRAAPVPIGARNAFEHFIRVRHGAKLRAASPVPRTESGDYGRNGDGRTKPE
jgi:hypothetical protein